MYRIARGTFWSMSGAIISRFLAFISSVLVARILGKEIFGELGIIHSTVGLFGVFAGFGIGHTATKYVAEFHKRDPERTGRIIGLSGLIAIFTGSLMALVLFFFAPFLASHTIRAAHLTDELQIGALVLCFSALNGSQIGALSGLEAFKVIAKINVITSIASIFFSIFLTWHYGLKGSVWALVIYLIFKWLLHHFALRKEVLKHGISFSLLKDIKKEIGILWSFSLPTALSGMLVGPVNWICCSMLVNQPDGYAEMGIYNAANQWYTILIFIPSILGQVVLPVLSQHIGNKEIDNSLKAMIISMKSNILIVLPIALLACAGSPIIMSLYGSSFKNGWPTLIIVLISTCLVSIYTPVSNMIMASGKMWIIFIMNFGCAVIFIISTMLLVHKGALGLATARGISYIFQTLWILFFVYHIVSLKKTKAIL